MVSLRRLTGALPVTGAVLVLGAVAVCALPGVRHTLSASFERRPERYVELYFTDPSTARSCAAVDGSLAVGVSLTSHLGGRADLAYIVAVTAHGTVTSRRPGTIATTPGRTAHAVATVAVPSGGYDVTVTLPGRSEHIGLHCGTSA